MGGCIGISPLVLQTMHYPSHLGNNPPYGETKYISSNLVSRHGQPMEKDLVRLTADLQLDFVLVVTRGQFVFASLFSWPTNLLVDLVSLPLHVRLIGSSVGLKAINCHTGNNMTSAHVPIFRDNYSSMMFAFDLVCSLHNAKIIWSQYGFRLPCTIAIVLRPFLLIFCCMMQGSYCCASKNMGVIWVLIARGKSLVLNALFCDGEASSTL